MVRNYKRKSDRASSWDLQKMTMGAAAIRNGELSLREASSLYGIPKSTLERHKNKKVNVPSCLGRFLSAYIRRQHRDRVGSLL